MQSLTHTSACTVLPRSRSDGRCQQSRLNRSHVTVRAEGKDPQGYVRKDSAGQENVYATEIKAFVGGDKKDANVNNAVAGIAASVAITAIAIGLLVTQQDQPTNLADIQAQVGTYKTLTEYAQIFSS